MKSYDTAICAQVEQQLVTDVDINNVPHGEIFTARYAEGNFFDYTGTYLFVAKKGGGNDWAIYGLPVMDKDEYLAHPHINPKLHSENSFLHNAREVPLMGLKLNDKDNIRLIVPCTDEALRMYRR